MKKKKKWNISFHLKSRHLIAVMTIFLLSAAVGTLAAGISTAPLKEAAGTILVPFEQSVIMYNKLRACGKHVEFYKVKGANHGEYFWTREVLQATIDFLKAHV